MSDTGQGSAADIEAQFKAQEGDVPGPLMSSDKYTGVPKGYKFEGRTKIRTAAGTEQDLYDIRKEANTILSTQLNDVDRISILQGLKSKGIGYSAREKVGNGFSDGDRSAFSTLLMLSNTYLMDYESTYKMLMAKVPSVKGGYKAPRVTAVDDVYAAVQSAAQSMLGRNLSDDELNQATSVIQRAEIRAQRGVAGPGGSVQQMPALSSLAAKQVEQQFGAESDEMSYMGFAELMNRAVNSRG